jgi:hypothetical protein
LQRYGLSLQDLVQQLAKQYQVQAITETNEAWGHVNVFLTDTIKNDEKSGKTIRRVVKGSTVDGDVKLRPKGGEQEKLKEGAQILVLASGNLGLVYGTNQDERVTLEDIENVYPGMLEGLVQHEGVGFVMVNSEEHGAVVIGTNGRAYLDEEQVEGDDPLLGFGPNAAMHLLRYNAFKDAPDIYVNSFYNAETNEVAAFEELIGCHGGMGGYQTRPFVLYPSEWQLEDKHLIGAPAVYHQFKRWLGQLQGANEAGKAIT